MGRAPSQLAPALALWLAAGASAASVAPQGTLEAAGGPRPVPLCAPDDDVVAAHVGANATARDVAHWFTRRRACRDAEPHKCAHAKYYQHANLQSWFLEALDRRLVQCREKVGGVYEGTLASRAQAAQPPPPQSANGAMSTAMAVTMPVTAADNRRGGQRVQPAEPVPEEARRRRRRRELDAAQGVDERRPRLLSWTTEARRRAPAGQRSSRRAEAVRGFAEAVARRARDAVGRRSARVAEAVVGRRHARVARDEIREAPQRRVIHELGPSQSPRLLLLPRRATPGVLGRRADVHFRPRGRRRRRRVVHRRFSGAR